MVIPTQLRSYTSGQSEVEASGGTLSAVLDDLDRKFPGLRFRVIDEQDRVRRHIILYVGGERQDDLASAIPPGAELMIVGALSGG